MATMTGMESREAVAPAPRTGPRADRIALWDVIHGLLPPRWRVPAAPGYDPSTRRWEIVARGPMPGGRRGKVPPYVIGGGQTELEALADLVRKLGEGPVVLSAGTPARDGDARPARA